MKNKKIFKYIFVFGLLCFFAYFICYMPTCIITYCLCYAGTFMPDLSRAIYDKFVRNSSTIKNIYYDLTYSIPEWTMPIATIINAANMILGFINYKKMVVLSYFSNYYHYVDYSC